MQTDEALMTAYREGDRAAFDALVKRHWGSVEEFLRRILRDDALAEDSLIECFFKLHRAAASYTPQARFKTFLFRIAYHEAIDALRTLRRQRQLGVVQLNGQHGEGPDVACVHPNPEVRTQQREDIHLLGFLLGTLNEKPRAVFLLHYREELTAGEIAEALEMPITSVRAYLSLARKALREGLKELEQSSDRRHPTWR